MTGRSTIGSDWTRLGIAPFTMRRGTEPSDGDIEWETGWAREFAIVPSYGHLWIDWERGSVAASIPDCDPDADDDGDYRLTAEAHPIQFDAEAFRSFGAAIPNEFSGLVRSFWGSLVARFDQLVAEGIVEIHARGGPQPGTGHAFRHLPSDIWRSSVVDWAEATCTTPDGHIYFSIHVGRSAPSRTQVGSSATKVDGAPVQVDVSPVRTRPMVSDGLGTRMSRPQAAEYIGLSSSWLEKRRYDPTNPPFHKPGGKANSKAVYYSAEIDAWRISEKGRKVLAETD